MAQLVLLKPDEPSKSSDSIFFYNKMNSNKIPARVIAGVENFCWMPSYHIILRRIFFYKMWHRLQIKTSQCRFNVCNQSICTVFFMTLFSSCDLEDCNGPTECNCLLKRFLHASEFYICFCAQRNWEGKGSVQA